MAAGTATISGSRSVSRAAIVARIVLVALVAGVVAGRVYLGSYQPIGPAYSNGLRAAGPVTDIYAASPPHYLAHLRWREEGSFLMRFDVTNRGLLPVNIERLGSKSDYGPFRIDEILVGAGEPVMPRLDTLHPFEPFVLSPDEVAARRQVPFRGLQHLQGRVHVRGLVQRRDLDAGGPQGCGSGLALPPREERIRRPLDGSRGRGR